MTPTAPASYRASWHSSSLPVQHVTPLSVYCLILAFPSHSFHAREIFGVAASGTSSPGADILTRSRRHVVHDRRSEIHHRFKVFQQPFRGRLSVIRINLQTRVHAHRESCCVACTASRRVAPMFPITFTLDPYFCAVCAINIMCSSHDINCPSPVVPPTMTPSAPPRSAPIS